MVQKIEHSATELLGASKLVYAIKGAIVAQTAFSLLIQS